jgi:hypothetical protein
LVFSNEKLFVMFAWYGEKFYFGIPEHSDSEPACWMAEFKNFVHLPVTLVPLSETHFFARDRDGNDVRQE